MMTQKMNRKQLEEILCKAHATCTFAYLRAVDLRRMDLVDIDLRNAILSGSDLRNANLCGANLEGANLRNANLDGANLIGINLRNADLNDASLSNADLSYANLHGVRMSGANLDCANLESANLSNATLIDADLSDANLNKVDLFEAKLHKANLMFADLSNASLGNANICSANLTGTVGLPIAPIVLNLSAWIYRQIQTDPETHLDMSNWHHTCQTTHCWGGWAIVAAGKAGKVLEDKLGSNVAAALILVANEPRLKGIVPDFYEDDKSAWEKIKELGEKNNGQE